MKPESSVLLVSAGGWTHTALRKVLGDAGIQVRSARNCAEARKIVKDLAIPAVLFCDTDLPDGTWMDVLALATQVQRRLPVVVVSRVVDINLYINALESGASDFIVPPFYQQDISHVLRCAAQDQTGAPKSFIPNVAAA
ncbi:MAG: response regulator [Acidobacteriota bacterium]